MAGLRTIALLAAISGSLAVRMAPAQKTIEHVIAKDNTTKAHLVEHVKQQNSTSLAAKLVPPEKTPKQLPAECKKQLIALEDPASQRKAHECEEKGKFPDLVVAALQKGDDKEAFAKAEQLFEKCGQFSKDCAALVAPGLVEEVRLSGMAVSDKCRDATKKLQTDGKHMKTASECDKKGKFSESVLDSLGQDLLPTALMSAEESLEKCMGLTKECAHQVAPILVNNVVQSAMEEQMQAMVMAAAPNMMAGGQPILVIEQPILVVEGPVQGLSLVGMATSKRPHISHKTQKGPAFLQKESRTRPWVSKLLLGLALKH